jgi:Fe-S-cluster-containing dehydrogenase component
MAEVMVKAMAEAMAKDIFNTHIVQYSQDYSLCAGCTSCEVVCSLVHDGLVGPCYNRIFLKRGTTNMLHTVLACMHCEDPSCYKKCPRQGEAMCFDEELGIAYINEEGCIGCGACRRACIFSPSRINLIKSKERSRRKAKKCDLCRTRDEGPACVQWCPVRCIGLSDQPRPVYEPPRPPGPPGTPPGAPPGPPGPPTGAPSGPTTPDDGQGSGVPLGAVKGGDEDGRQ